MSEEFDPKQASERSRALFALLSDDEGWIAAEISSLAYSAGKRVGAAQAARLLA